jgi:hypothetical protein
LINNTVPGIGVIVPMHALISPSNLEVCTAPGSQECIYWGDHLTMFDSPSCAIRVRNKGSTPVTLSMTATFNGNNATIPTPSPPGSKMMGVSWDKEGTKLNPGDYVNATLHLHLGPSMMPPRDFPFMTQVTITGTP